MIEYLPLLLPIMRIICFITLAAYGEVHLRTIKLGLASFAIIFTASYLSLLRKASILRYSRNLMRNSLLSILILSAPAIRMQFWPTCEQLVVGSYSYNGDRNYNLKCKIFLAYVLLVALFLGLSEFSFIQARISEDPRLHQAKEFLATRFSFLANREITAKIQQVRNSPSFIRSVALMPIVYAILALQIHVTPMNKEWAKKGALLQCPTSQGTYTIELAYNARI